MAERLRRMLDLACSLSVNTESGELDWVASAKMRGQFETTVAGSTVSIAGADADGNYPFTLVLWGALEHAISDMEWHSLEALSTCDFLDGAPDGWQSVLAHLWRVARSRALRVDERLDAILRELAEPSLLGVFPQYLS